MPPTKSLFSPEPGYAGASILTNDNELVDCFVL